MVKLGLVVAAVGLIGVGLATAYPVAEDGERELQQHQFRQGGLAAIFGSIGTALVPIVGAILGPILTNLASGITDAFNNGISNMLNSIARCCSVQSAGSWKFDDGLASYHSACTHEPMHGGWALDRTTTTAAAPSKVDSHFLDAHGLVVRIPPDSPLYLLAHPPPADKEEGLPAVGATSTGPLLHKPLQFGGKFGTGYRPELADDRDSVVVDAPANGSNHNEDVKRHDAPATVVKRHQHRVRAET